ncbi:MAG: DUF4431 domain-containing protein [Rhodomicrobium sp.]
MTGYLRKKFIITLFAWASIVSGSLAHAACLDVNQTGRLAFEGTLTFHVFGGPPYNGGVRLGDTPEPTYILKLDGPICATGDEFVDPNTAVEGIQIYPEDAENRELSRDLRRFAGQRVRVEGKSVFGTHTGHHHAPLLLPITQIRGAARRCRWGSKPSPDVRAISKHFRYHELTGCAPFYTGAGAVTACPLQNYG